MENVHFDWFDQYLCSGEHLQSDLDIFQFDYKFVKPHEVPPLLYANVQTEIRFGVEQLRFTTPSLWNPTANALQYINIGQISRNEHFHVNNRRGALCLSQGRRMGYPACISPFPNGRRHVEGGHSQPNDLDKIWVHTGRWWTEQCLHVRLGRGYGSPHQSTSLWRHPGRHDISTLFDKPIGKSTHFPISGMIYRYR